MAAKLGELLCSNVSSACFKHICMWPNSASLLD